MKLRTFIDLLQTIPDPDNRYIVVIRFNDDGTIDFAQSVSANNIFADDSKVFIEVV